MIVNRETIRNQLEITREYIMIDFTTMSDKQIIKAYNQFVSPKTFNIMEAGIYAAELVKRGYGFIEVNNIEKMVKKTKKEVMETMETKDIERVA